MKQKGGKTRQRGLKRWATVVWSLPLTATAQSVLDMPATQVAAGGGFSCSLTTNGGVKCWGGISRPTPVPVVDASDVPLATVVSIVTGQGHACALLQAGGVKCWGDNQYGQLGNTAAAYYGSTPVTVVDSDNIPIGGVAQIGAGAYSTCALTSVGGIECWGNNYYGQLGNGSTYDSPTAVPVDGLPGGVLGVSVGAFHACAVTIAGNVACWGNDNYGQLGNHASGGVSPTPVAVVDVNNRQIGGIVAVSAGFDSSCALTTAGTVQCWGYSYGDTPMTVSGLSNIVALNENCGVTAAGGVKCWGGANHTPTDFVGLTSGIAAISEGASHTCALTSGGGVLCLGDDTDGELGDGVSSATPAPVSGLGAGVKAISAASRYTCAISATDAAMCWGDNTDGQLGNGSMSTVPSSAPVQVQTLTSGVTAISSGTSHSCAVVSGGVKCWGINQTGELGNNSNNASPTPVTVVDGSNAPLSGMSTVASGFQHTCALNNIGGVRCWGSNFFGQLGNNNPLGNSAVAVTVVDAGNVPLSGVKDIAAGRYHTCALMTGGGLKCWGHGGVGELGNNSFSGSPVATPVVDGNNIPIAGMAGISAGWDHTCAFTMAGAAKCWGDNQDAELGDNTYGTNRNAPVNVVGLTTGVTAIAGGEFHTCAITVGGVKCWGENDNGDLGNPSIGVRSLVPIPVVDASNTPVSSLAAISSGGLHTCGIGGSGVQCWGWNRYGQLGHSINRATPAPVWGSSAGIAQIALGNLHTCARTPSGGILCWGANGAGQLGSPAGSASAIPIAARDSGGQPLGAFVEIATGALHTCARSPSGAVICWGSDGSGQLGNHSAGGSSTIPVRVVDSNDAPLANAAGLAAGAAHTCAVNASGGVMCWGYNAYGQLGNNNRPNDSDVTVAVATSTANNSPIGGIATVVAGADHTCALTAAHGLKCWGDNEYGQLGNNSGGTPGSVSTAPVDVSGFATGVAAVAVGDFFSCAVTTSQGAQCWGYNGAGQLGTNDTQKRLSPTDVSGLTSGVAAVVAGSNHACALTTSGGMKCWGDNGSGQLGDGSTAAQRNLPVNVSGLGSGVVAIAAGGDHTCALTTQGLLKCWGADESGQLGNNSSTPLPVPGPVDVLKGQSIAFTPARSMGLGTLNLSATTSSGLGVVFDTWTPATCQVNGAKLTASAYGLCGVRVSQAGGANGQNGTIATAPQQLRIISISNQIFGSGFE